MKCWDQYIFSFKIQKYVLFCSCDVERSVAFYFAFCLLWDELLEMAFQKIRTHVHIYRVYIRVYLDVYVLYIVYIRCAQFGNLMNATISVHMEELCTKWVSLWFFSNESYRNHQIILQCLLSIPMYDRRKEKKLNQQEGFPNPLVFLCAWKSRSVWGGRSLQHMFFHGSQRPAGMVRKNQKSFPLHALPHLSMLLGLWSRRLSWCPPCCFT